MCLCSKSGRIYCITVILSVIYLFGNLVFFLMFLGRKRNLKRMGLNYFFDNFVFFALIILDELELESTKCFKLGVLFYVLGKFAVILL